MGCKIAIAGNGYVGLSLGVLLAQHNDVITLHILEEKVKPINQRISLIKDAYIINLATKYF